VDWDHDGDLDLWQSNRTSPRLRFLRNNTVTPEAAHAPSRWVSLKLEGRRSNRDAIGARVTILVSDSDKPLMRTVRAGEGYLSQSSKRLHFGIGPNAQIQTVSVRWPDGSKEMIQGVQPNGHYVIVQGESAATAWQRSNGVTTIVRNRLENLPEPSVALRRIVAHRRLPIPDLELIDPQGEPQTVRASSPTLVVVWATWCVPCLSELKMLAEHQSMLAELNLNLVTLSVDEMADDQNGDARSISKQPPFALLSKLGIDGTQGIATESTKLKLDLLQRNLLSRQRTLSIPSSLLLDERGRLVILYQGAVSLEQLQADVRMIQRPDSDNRDSAVPLAGRWFVNEVPADVMSVVEKLVAADLPLDALEYLDQHLLPYADTSTASPSTAAIWSKEQIAGAYLEVGVQLGRAGSRSAAERAILTSVRIAPRYMAARAALASLLEAEKRYGEALEVYEAMRRLQPQNPIILNNMAWILASVDDSSVANPGRAVALAEQACQITNRRVVVMLDTLAAAYASDGQTERAASVIDEAIALARANGDQQAETRLRAKRLRYQPQLE
jgi:tetratricopeptide (TPR) repeat protein